MSAPAAVPIPLAVAPECPACGQSMIWRGTMWACARSHPEVSKHWELQPCQVFVFSREASVGSVIERVPVPGELCAPGLVLHEQLNWGSRGPFWTISHAASGYAVRQGITTKARALELAGLLAELGDWERPEEQLRADAEFWAAAGALIRREPW